MLAPKQKGEGRQWQTEMIARSCVLGMILLELVPREGGNRLMPFALVQTPSTLPTLPPSTIPTTTPSLLPSTTPTKVPSLVGGRRGREGVSLVL